MGVEMGQDGIDFPFPPLSGSENSPWPPWSSHFMSVLDKYILRKKSMLVTLASPALADSLFQCFFPSKCPDGF